MIIGPNAKREKRKHGKDKLILSACSCRTYPSKSKVGPTQNISYFRDSVLYFRFLIASRVGEEEEDERKKGGDGRPRAAEQDQSCEG